MQYEHLYGITFNCVCAKHKYLSSLNIQLHMTTRIEESAKYRENSEKYLLNCHFPFFFHFELLLIL